MAAGLLLIVWILMNIHKGFCSVPTAAPTFNPNLVYFPVMQHLGNFNASSVNSTISNLFRSVVNASLVCCHDYTIVITSTTARPDANTEFNYTIQFEYESLDFASAETAYNFITTELEKEIVEGGFKRNIDDLSSQEACTTTTCIGFDDSSVGSYSIGDSLIPFPTPQPTVSSVTDDGTGYLWALVCGGTLSFLLIAFCYLQYFYPRIPFCEKELKLCYYGKEYEWDEENYEVKRKKIARHKKSIISRRSKVILDEMGEEQEIMEEVMVEVDADFDYEMQARVNDITDLADPDARFGRGHSARRKSSVRAVPLKLQGHTYFHGEGRRLSQKDIDLHGIARGSITAGARLIDETLLQRGLNPLITPERPISVKKETPKTAEEKMMDQLLGNSLDSTVATLFNSPNSPFGGSFLSDSDEEDEEDANADRQNGLVLSNTRSPLNIIQNRPFATDSDVDSNVNRSKSIRAKSIKKVQFNFDDGGQVLHLQSTSNPLSKEAIDRAIQERNTDGASPKRASYGKPSYHQHLPSRRRSSGGPPSAEKSPSRNVQEGPPSASGGPPSAEKSPSRNVQEGPPSAREARFGRPSYHQHLPTRRRSSGGPPSALSPQFQSQGIVEVKEEETGEI
jgi:hypothetical protein